MIALVAGDVAVRRPDHVVVETASGVGYRLAVSAETLRHVPRGRACRVPARPPDRPRRRSRPLRLPTEEERDLFLLLIGVQSVGPKVALAVLGGGTPRELVTALALGTPLASRPSPGSASASPSGSSSSCARRSAPATGARRHGAVIAVHRGDDPRLLARDGLVELGWSLVEAEELLRQAWGDTAEALLAQALRGAGR